MYRSLGPDAVREISPIENGRVDETHLNDWAGKLVGHMVAGMLRRENEVFDHALDWRGVKFRDTRAGETQVRPVTHGSKTLPTPRGIVTLVVDANDDSFCMVQGALPAVPDNIADRTVMDNRESTYFGTIIVGQEKQSVTYCGHDSDWTTLTDALNGRASLSDHQGHLFNGAPSPSWATASGQSTSPSRKRRVTTAKLWH